MENNYKCPRCQNVFPEQNKIMHDIKCTVDNPMPLDKSRLDILNNQNKEIKREIENNKNNDINREIPKEDNKKNISNDREKQSFLKHSSNSGEFPNIFVCDICHETMAESEKNDHMYCHDLEKQENNLEYNQEQIEEQKKIEKMIEEQNELRRQRENQQNQRTQNQRENNINLNLNNNPLSESDIQLLGEMGFGGMPFLMNDNRNNDINYNRSNERNNNRNNYRNDDRNDNRNNNRNNIRNEVGNNNRNNNVNPSNNSYVRRIVGPNGQTFIYSYSNNSNSNNSNEMLNQIMNNISRPINITFNRHNNNENNQRRNRMMIPFLSINELNLSDIFSSLRNENPTDTDILNELPETQIDDVNKLDGEKKSCVICLETFKNGDKATILPCIHLFHTNCIKLWLETKNFCPICKFKLTGENLDQHE